MIFFSKIAVFIRRKLFSVSPKNVEFIFRGFYHGDFNKSEHLEEIGRKFLSGYHYAIDPENYSTISAFISKESSNFRGFCFEGAAMALTILDFFSLIKKNRVKEFSSHKNGNQHIYMLHVGVGWAYARLPVRIERVIEKYDTILRWLIIDGYGFHQAYFKTKKYVYECKEPTEIRNSFSRHVFYQGVGRCLWFVESAIPERIANRILSFKKEYHADLWSGVGLACTYAGVITDDEIERLKILSEDYLPYLIQGSAFAAKARERAVLTNSYTEKACQIICRKSVKEIAAITDYCLSQIPENLPSEDKYTLWRKLIRDKICEQNENIFQKMAY